MTALSIGDECIIRDPSEYKCIPEDFFEGKSGTIVRLPAYDYGWNQPVAVLKTEHGECIRLLTYLQRKNHEQPKS